MNQEVNLLKYLATVDSSIGKMYDKLIKELAKIGASINDLDTGKLFSFADYPQVKERVEKILDKYTSSLEERITNGMRDAIDMSYLANTSFLKDYSKLSNKALRTQRETAKEAFIRSRRKSRYGLGLSNRVWNYTNQAKAEFEAGMSEVIEEGFSDGISAEELGRLIRDKLKYPDMVYKRYHLKKLTKEGKKDVIEWRKKVIDEDGKVRFIKTELDMVGRGVYRSSRKNALRLAATEINMAYRYADNVRWQSEPFIRGIRIRLSGNHTLNGKPFYDICDELQGDYPKSFMWSGWHPRCYSDDSEVLTTEGWKLFKDVSLFDSILSLNPDNRKTEAVPILSVFRWHSDDDMVHLISKDVDYLVTKDHEILIEDGKNIRRVEASLFDCSSNGLIDSPLEVKKEYISYNGYVYDLELERNHIMYIRRNGKCFWGSNCRCSASPILVSQEEMDEIAKLSEEEYQNYQPKDAITKMPDGFKTWFEENKERIIDSIKRGKQPYFIRDNDSWVNNLLDPKKRTEEQERVLVEYWNEKKKRTAFLRGRAENVMRVYEERFGFDVQGLSMFEEAIKDGELNALDAQTKRFAKSLSKTQRVVRQNAINQVDMAKQVPEVDYSELESLLKGNHIGLINQARIELEQRTFDMIDAENALSDLIDDVRELHKTYKISDLQTSHNELDKVMNRWLSKYGYSTIWDAPLSHLKNKLTFEITSPTISYTHKNIIDKVLQDKIIIVEKKIQWDELIERANILRGFKTKSTIYKSLLDSVDEAIYNDDFDALRNSIAAAESKKLELISKKIKRTGDNGTALNKEYKGGVVGQDITAQIDVSNMVSEDPYRGTFTNNVARMQGFDSPAKLVSKEEFDKLAQDCGDVFFRTLNPAKFNGKYMSGEEFANQLFLADKLELNGPGGRVYGDGIYVASSSWNGRTLNQITKKLINDAYQESAGYGYGNHKTLELTWTRKPNIIKQEDLFNMWDRLSYEEKMKYGGTDRSFANTYACSLGYDAMYCKGPNYIVVWNRSIIAVKNT